MYLFVFILVVLSVLGLYTQIFTLRVASLAANQKGVADTMMLWHGGMSRFIQDRMRANATAGLVVVFPTPEGCLVFGGGGLNCGTIPNLADFTIPAVSNVYLPGYVINDAALQFFSLLFEQAGMRYVLTYQPAATMRLGFTTDQLYAQMRKAGLPSISYGRVVLNGPCGGMGNGNWLMTEERTAAGVNVCYALPANTALISNPATYNLTNGSIGIISSAQ